MDKQEWRATRDTIFDTVFVPENLGTQGNIHAFAIPLGCYAGRRIKDVDDTNMLMPGMLAAPDTFDVQTISVAVIDDAGHVLTKELVWNTVLRFQVNTKEVLAAPIRDFDDGFLLDTIAQRKGPLCRMENGERVYLRPLISVSIGQSEPRITHIHQAEYFGCRLYFQEKPDRPMRIVIGLSGVRYFIEW